MDFVGPAKRLQPGDIGRVARSIKVPTSSMLAVVEIEAGSRGFDAKGRPICLFEPHRFYAELGAGPSRDKAVRAGLAYAKWGTKPYPKGSDAQYDRIIRAIAIDRDAALAAVSWGLPQILGSNFKDAGFISAMRMVESYKLGELEQLYSMASLIQAWGLDEAMRSFGSGGEKTFARRYNGPGYAKHSYDVRLATAARKHANVDDAMTVSLDSLILYPGQKGEQIRAMQADLIALGLLPEGEDDGRFGPKTEAALKQFQTAEGLYPDGRFGIQTRTALDLIIAKIDVDPAGQDAAWTEREDEDVVAAARLAEANAEDARIIAEAAERIRARST